MTKKIIPLIVIILFSSTTISQNLSKEQLDKWINDPDAPIPEVTKKRKINEGQLTFLDRVKHKDVMHSEIKIVIKPDSLKNGWVTLNQCYRNLDAFPRVEVIYTQRQIKDLKVLRVEKIASAKVKGTSVQMEKVQKGATLCVSAQVKSLTKTSAGYMLENGPYKRKFLDGYFPLRVSVSVSYPGNILKIAGLTPESYNNNANTGMLIHKASNMVRFDATFEGILKTRIDFSKTL